MYCVRGYYSKMFVIKISKKDFLRYPCKLRWKILCENMMKVRYKIK